MNRHERRGAVFAVIVTIFVLIFMGVGGWLLYSDWRVNTEFLPVQATIITSEVGVSRNRNRTTYYPDITFSYEVDGTVHTTGEYRIPIVSSSDRYGKRKIVRRHAVGSKHEAWYDPDHPSVAVLNRDYNVVGFVFGGVGIAIPLIALVVMVTRASRARSCRTALHDLGISAPGNILGVAHK